MRSEAIDVRVATQADAGAIADLFWTARAAAVPAIPMIVHPRSTVLPFIRDVVLACGDVWVATVYGAVIGFVAVSPPDHLDHLYLAPSHIGSGVGSALVDLVKGRHPDGLQLWVFQSNTAAIRFYGRHGFEPAESTDGDNEEGAPDLRMVWAGRDGGSASGNNR